MGTSLPQLSLGQCERSPQQICRFVTYCTPETGAFESSHFQHQHLEFSLFDNHVVCCTESWHELAFWYADQKPSIAVCTMGSPTCTALHKPELCRGGSKALGLWSGCHSLYQLCEISTIPSAFVGEAGVKYSINSTICALEGRKTAGCCTPQTAMQMRKQREGYSKSYLLYILVRSQNLIS